MNKLNIKVQNTNLAAGSVLPEKEVLKEPTQNNFGDYLKGKRNEKNLSLRALAAKAKISYSALNKAENGRELPSANMLCKIAPYLGIPIDELLFEAGYHFKYPKDGPIYLDLTGEILDLEKIASNMYNHNIELFLQIVNWYLSYNKEDAEIISCILNICDKKNRIFEKKKKFDLTVSESGFIKLWETLKQYIQTCSFYLTSLKSAKEN